MYGGAHSSEINIEQKSGSMFWLGAKYYRCYETELNSDLWVEGNQ